MCLLTYIHDQYLLIHILSYVTNITLTDYGNTKSLDYSKLICELCNDKGSRFILVFYDEILLKVDNLLEILHNPNPSNFNDYYLVRNMIESCSVTLFDKIIAKDPRFWPYFMTGTWAVMRDLFNNDRVDILRLLYDKYNARFNKEILFKAIKISKKSLCIYKWIIEEKVIGLSSWYDQGIFKNIIDDSIMFGDIEVLVYFYRNTDYFLHNATSFDQMIGLAEETSKWWSTDKIIMDWLLRKNQETIYHRWLLSFG